MSLEGQQIAAHLLGSDEEFQTSHHDGKHRKQSILDLKINHKTVNITCFMTQYASSFHMRFFFLL